jgi:hypothetical protein
MQCSRAFHSPTQIGHELQRVFARPAVMRFGQSARLPADQRT